MRKVEMGRRDGMIDTGQRGLSETLDLKYLPKGKKKETSSRSVLKYRIRQMFLYWVSGDVEKGGCTWSEEIHWKIPVERTWLIQ